MFAPSPYSVDALLLFVGITYVIIFILLLLLVWLMMMGSKPPKN